MDFDLSIFRLVKSFAAVEISRNVGASGLEDVAGEAAGGSVGSHDADARGSAVRPGLSATTVHFAAPAVDAIPEAVDNDMRAALDQRLEGPEREAVSWQHGQRSAALSLAGLARPGSSADSGQGRSDASSQAALDESDGAGASVLATNKALSPARTIAGLAAAAESAHGALPVLATAPTDARTHGGAMVGAGAPAVPSDARFAGKDAETPPLLPASAVSLLGEAQMAEALQSMLEGGREDRPALATTAVAPDDGGTVSPDDAEQPAPRNAAMPEVIRNARSPLAAVALGAEQAEVRDSQTGEREPLSQRQRQDAGPASQALATTALMQERTDALARGPSNGDISADIWEEGAARASSSESIAGSQGDGQALTSAVAASKAAATLSGPKLLELLDALVALSPQASEGSEDWQSLSSVILNAAMIPGWPPPRPIENPAAARQGNPLVPSAETTEADETPMTPEQLLAYLVSIGANLRLLRALQELVSRVEKKEGPALLAWLTGLVSALKLIEKSLKDMIEDGMELPKWLAELADAAKRPRRRKQFHI